MSKFICSVILSIVFFNAIFSQSKTKIYFISGNSRDIVTVSENEQHASSFYSEYFCKTNPIILWRLDADSLQVVDTLNYKKMKNGIFTNIRHFEDEKWFYMMESDVDYTSSRFDTWEDLKDHVSILDYSGDSIFLRRINTDSLFQSKRLIFPGRQYFNNSNYFTTCSAYNTNGYTKLIYCNRFLDTLHIINKLNLENLQIKAESGYQDNYWFTRINYNSEGKFHTRNYLTKEWESFEFYVPSSKGDGNIYEYFNICYVTPSSRYLIGHKEKGKDLDSLVTMYIHDRHLENWDSIKLPRYYRKFNVFEDKYAYGSGVLQYIEKDTEAAQDISLAKNAHKYESNYGCTPDLRKAFGRFFILHLPTMTLDELVFEERDVELLALNDFTIYYRKFDEIRSVKINKDHKIERSTDCLLLKNTKVVPFIHHILFSKAKIFKTELVSSKNSK